MPNETIIMDSVTCKTLIESIQKEDRIDTIAEYVQELYYLVTKYVTVQDTPSTVVRYMLCGANSFLCTD
ncbi:MAG: hypothetical protein NC548_29685 [Lachnospiraceae bacterium]|nr:hypothetical protein [Lachnospiraceae bacterium]